MKQFGEIERITVQFISKNFYSAFVFFQDTISSALAIAVFLFLTNRL